MRLYIFLILFGLPTVAVSEIDNKNQHILASAPLHQRSLRSVLNLFQQHDYNIIYSDYLVDKNWVVWQNARSGNPISRLEWLLGSFGLKLNYDIQNNAYYVVKDSANLKKIQLQVVPPAPSDCTLELRDDQHLRPYQQDHSNFITVFIGTNGTLISIRCGDYDELVINNPNEEQLYPLAFQSSASSSETEEIVTTGTQYFIHTQNTTSRTQLFEEDLHAIPLRGNDPIQVLNTIPGMATSGVSAKPYIQGGEDSELLIRIDGVELVDPFHMKDFYSLYSGINPDIVDSITFYKGIYPARFGGKMSGVMDISSGSEVEQHPYSIGFDAFTTSMHLAGTSRTNNAFWNFYGRRGNLNEILDAVDPEIGTPRFSDTFSKFHWGANDQNSVDVGFLTINDDIRLSRAEENYTESAKSQYENQYGWVRWQHEDVIGGTHDISLSSVNIKNSRKGTLTDPDPFSGSSGALEDKKDYDLTRITYDFSRQYSDKRSFSGGINLSYATSRYTYSAQAELGSIANTLGFLQHLQQVDTASQTMTSGSLYATLEQKILERAAIEFGLRHDWQESDFYNSDQLSPRLLVSFDTSTNSSLQLGYGRYYQHSAITELSLENKLPHTYSPQKSDHLSVDWTQKISPQLSISLSGYYKFIYNPKARGETLLTQYHFLPELSADRFVVRPKFSQLRGMDISALYQIGHFTTQASYAAAVHKDYHGEGSSFRRWSQKHSVNLQIAWHKQSLEISSHIMLHSGWRYTDIINQIFDGQFNALSDYNNQTLPQFYTVDFSISYEQKLKNSVLMWNSQITNLTDNKNIGSYSYNIDDTYSSGTPRLEKSENALLPIIPSIGIHWYF